MTNLDAGSLPTTTPLLDTLREVTGRPELDYRDPPTLLAGGFYAEMLRFRLADPPAELDRELVARIVPNAAAGVWEATIQRHVGAHGFPTPTVRLTAAEKSPLGRYLIVMDHVDGRPPMDGLDFATIATQIPHLLRHLPDQLARMATRLHALDPEPLAAELAALGTSIPTTTAGFVEEQIAYAEGFDRPDLVAAGERLLARQPVSTVVAIAHGDLHPFNLLVTQQGVALIDWTVARVAHPGFTLGFTQLVLANPPIALPKAAAALLGVGGRNMAKRFVRTYRTLTAGTGAEVDDGELAWHRKVHALRILVETAHWDAEGTPRPRGHPWLVLEPVARRELDLPPA